MYPRITLAETGWYHSFELPGGRRFDGMIPLDRLRERWRKLGLPEDLSGMRALDVGAWDGWFSFELERRGADVVAVDTADVEGFTVVHEALGSKVERRLQSVYELNPATIGRFDVVLFQGVLYHLKHPLLGLEKVCSVATDIVRVESYVAGETDDSPRMEFYERSELRGQFDNWFGPSVACLLGLCRAAGFAEVELLDVSEARALVSCSRRWPDLSGRPSASAPLLLAATGASTRSETLTLNTEEYAALYFKSDEDGLTERDVLPTIGGLAASVAELRRTGGDGWTAVCRIPPGIGAGAAEVFLRTRRSAPSNVIQVNVVGTESPKWRPERPVSPLAAIVIAVVADGKTWRRDVVENRERCLSLWVRGLADDVRAADLRVDLGRETAEVVFLSGRMQDETRQINVQIPSQVAVGATTVRVGCRGTWSEAVPLEVAAESR